MIDFKSNINKIHFSLNESFANLSIVEKSSIELGKFFEISIFNENKNLKMILQFSALEKNTFKWFYSENPLNESSDLIERLSTTDSLLSDITDIFNKDRFSEDYLNAIKN